MSWKTEFDTLKEFKRNAPIIQTYFDGFTTEAKMLVSCRGVSEDNLSFFKDWISFFDNTSIPKDGENHIIDKIKKHLTKKRFSQSEISISVLESIAGEIKSSWSSDINILFNDIHKYLPLLATHFTIYEQDLISKSGCFYLIPSIKKDMTKDIKKLNVVYFKSLRKILSEKGDIRLEQDQINIDNAIGVDAKKNAGFIYGTHKESLLNALHSAILVFYRDEPTLATYSTTLISSVVHYIRKYPFQTQLQMKNGATSIVTIGSDIFEKIADYVVSVSDSELLTRIQPPSSGTYTAVQNRMTFLGHVTQAIEFARMETPSTAQIDELFLDSFSRYEDNKKRLFYTYTFRRAMHKRLLTGMPWMTDAIFNALEQENITFSDVISILETPRMDLTLFRADPLVQNILIKYGL